MMLMHIARKMSLDFFSMENQNKNEFRMMKKIIAVVITIPIQDLAFICPFYLQASFVYHTKMPVI